MSDMKLAINNEEENPSLVIDNADNVAIALADLNAGTFSVVRIGEQQEKVKLTEDISYGNKFSINSLAKNESVYKYGEEIGKMKNSVEKGVWIHTHNMYCDRGMNNER